MSVLVDSTPSAPAAQVYECRGSGGGFTWSFVRPEAGLQPIPPETVPGLETLVLDHLHFIEVQTPP